MKLIISSKYSKFNVDSENAIDISKKRLALQIITFELVAVNCPYYYDNTPS